MAGDWIKLQKDTPDKPEVLAIAARLGIDQDAVTGKLVRIWAWFDTHTTDGNASCVTYAFLDRLAGVTGFAEQMALVGWLEQNGSDLRLPNFDYHTGETAKRRALGKNRAEKHRSNAVSNDASVTETSLEKRREEKIKKEHCATPSADGFELFWSLYPRKVGKGAAEKAWGKAVGKDDSLPTRISLAVRVAKASEQWRKDGGKYIPNPATFLNQRRWEDELQDETVPRTLRPWTPDGWDAGAFS